MKYLKFVLFCDPYFLSECSLLSSPVLQHYFRKENKLTLTFFAFNGNFFLFQTEVPKINKTLLCSCDRRFSRRKYFWSLWRPTAFGRPRLLWPLTSATECFKCAHKSFSSQTVCTLGDPDPSTDATSFEFFIKGVYYLIYRSFQSSFFLFPGTAFSFQQNKDVFWKGGVDFNF